MSLLLASWLVTQTWQWSPVPTATSYRIYWQADTPMLWCSQNYVEFPASVCTATDCQGEIPQPTASVVYVNVTAVNANGESAWDHGAKGVCP
jgi:hypothetical protein